MYSKLVLFCAFFAASAQIAVASSPACLLKALNKFEHPADQETICTQQAGQAKEYIDDLCPALYKDDALEAFKAACDDKGFDTNLSTKSSSDDSPTETGKPGKHGFGSSYQTGAPYPISGSSGYAGPSGFLTGTAPVATGTSSPSSGSGSGSGSGAGGAGSGAGATGSPIAPVSPSSTGSGSSSAPGAHFTGAASKNIGSVAAGLLAVAAIAVSL